MEAQIKSDIVEEIYAGDPAAKPFIDSEALMEIPTSSRFQATDGLLRRRQRDMGVIAHALTTSLDDLEGAANQLISANNELEEGPVKDRLLQAHKELTQASTHLLGHVLRIIASKFNDIAKQRRAALASTTNDQVLAQQIRATPLGFDSLLASSLQPAIQASSSRWQQDLLTATLRSNSRSARPARRERSRSPARRPHPGQGQQQAQNSRHGQQPFRPSRPRHPRSQRQQRRSGYTTLFLQAILTSQAVWRPAGTPLYGKQSEDTNSRSSRSPCVLSTSSSHEQGKARGPTERSGLPTEERSHREGQGLSQVVLLKPVSGEQK